MLKEVAAPNMTTQSEDLGQSYLFHQLDEYPFDRDEEFQGGLRAILGSVQDPSQVEHLTLRAKCYYYARKSGTAVDFGGYKRWVEDQRATEETLKPTQNGKHDNMLGGIDEAARAPAASLNDAADVSGMNAAPKPASFAEICDMIADGKPIPGIKDIPDTILEGQQSDASVTRRMKPWEKKITGDASTQNDAPEAMRKLSWMT